jgi:hypothetical protein
VLAYPKEKKHLNFFKGWNAPRGPAVSAPGALSQAKAAAEKEAGNCAFAAKKYEEAAAHFSACIALDPS